MLARLIWLNRDHTAPHLTTGNKLDILVLLFFPYVLRHLTIAGTGCSAGGFIPVTGNQENSAIAGNRLVSAVAARNFLSGRAITGNVMKTQTTHAMEQHAARERRYLNAHEVSQSDGESSGSDDCYQRRGGAGFIF
ncbi:hypothetical protein KCP77_14505 [Salmonella enterica subsp. enterica]|nr:hypothetical protein KCP77_14505 [Salmonella enterica subsp. enterica]